MNTTRSSQGPDASPVAIIGMGCMFPRARNLREYWRLLRSGTDGITDTPPSHWNRADYLDADPKAPDKTYCGRGGFLDPVAFDPTEFGIPPAILEATDTSQLLGLVVAKAALDDAGYGDGRDFNRDRASVILGVTGLQELALPLGARLGHPIWRRALAESGVAADIAEEVVRRISESYVGWQENSFPGLLGNVVAGRIANRLNLRGTNCVVDAACASSLSAVHLAMMELAAGRCDMALAGGVDTLNDIFMYMCFSKTPALSPTGDARPFSDTADGTVLGEGIGMLVLKRLADAQRDGDRIYAVIRSIGTSSDGRSQSIYAPHAGGQARALRDAYAIAGVDPQTITLIEAHGTGTIVGDAVEFEALKTVFREAASDGAWCAVGSVKSQIGHTKAAAGAAGLIKAALAIYHRALPPTIKIKAPNPKLSVDDSPFYLSTELRPWIPAHSRPRRAGVSSFGFGGSNFHAVLEEHEQALPEPAWDGSVQIIALSAASVDGLQSQIADWLSAFDDVGFDAQQLAWRAAHSRQSFDSSQEHRLLFVVEAGADLKAMLLQSAARLGPGHSTTDWASPNVFYGRGIVDGKIAFLFPGQGSQYVNMGRDLACTFPEFHDVVADADAAAADFPEHRIAGAIYPLPTFSEQARRLHAESLTQTDVAQPALGAICLGMANVLRRFNIQPDMAAGHSYGELVALHVAGVYAAGAFHQLSRLRGRLMAGGDGDRGAMLAVHAPLEEIARLIAAENLDVVLANRNAPTQGVLSGPREAIVVAAECCKSRGFAAKALAVSGAFHSRLMESAVTPFRQALEAVAFQAPLVPVFSTSTAQPYPADPAADRAQLAEQLIRPVAFVGQIENMYQAGARTFIEVGPRKVVSGLVESILGERPYRSVAVDASNGRASGIVDLARLLAQLAAEGRAVDMTRWEKPVSEPRKPKMVVPLVGANHRAPRQRLDCASRTTSRVANASPGPELTPSGANLSPILTAPGANPSPGGAIENSSGRKPWDEIAEVVKAPEGRQSAAQCDGARLTGSSKETIRGASISHPLLQRQPDPSPLPDALRVMQEGIHAMQALQQQTAEAHRRFLEGQEQAHRSIQLLIENQYRLFTGGPVMISAASSPPPAQSEPTPQGLARVRTDAPAPHTIVQRAPALPLARSELTPQGVAPVRSPSFAPPIAPTPPTQPNTDHAAVVLEVVCEKTGYPREMIDLDMDIEADLGIDSIKRVEIVAAVEERIPSFTGIKPEYMGSMRTLRQIVSAIEPAPAARGAAVATDRGEGPMPREISPAASADAMNRLTAEVAADAATGVPRDPRTFSETLLAVVSELTGYPGEMLDLAMDLEADLGIDSIKRVEILAAVEARVPAMPTVQPEYMGGLRTLQQIVDYCAGVNAPTQMPAPAPPTQPIPAPGTSPPGEKSLLRRALVPVDLPPVSPSILPVAPGRTVLIVDDGTSLATELAARISAVGFPTRVIDAAAVTVTHENVAALIILATPCGQPGKAWSPQTEKLLKNAFALTKASAIGLMESAAQGGAMFVCISRMDGAFGLLGGEYDPVQGGLAGLAKTAAHEWPGVACRAVDVAQSWDDAVAVADAVLAELSAAGPIEVGLDVATRRGLELIPAACAAGPARISSDDVIVITGGARGVAAETAVALARHYHPRLTLLGRSPAPTDEPAWLSGLESESQIKLAILSNEFGGRARPQQVQAAYDRQMAQREIRRTLSRLAELGAAAEYRSVDVRNADAVRREVSDIRSRFGPVRGLIHAAGVLEDRLIVDKTPEQFARVFDTKVGGLRNLLDALSLHELRHLVLFSSVSARFGNRGQADYAMANEVLNKVAHRLSAQLPDCRVRSLNWGPWDGGMVGPGLKREFLRQGIDLIPLADGADALVAELTDVGPSIEIVLGAGFRPIAPAQPRSPETCAANGHFSLAFERSLDVAGHAFLSSHVLGGRPVLPLAVTMEWLGHAAIHAHPGLLLCGFEDIRVLKGVSLENGEPSLRFFTSEARLDGALLYVPVEMRGDGPDGREVVHASGNAVVAPTLPVAPAIGYSDALAERPFPRSIDEIYSDLLFHGEHFRGIQKVDGWCPRGLVAQLRAAAPPVRWMCDPIRSDWLVDPLILDSAFQMAILWCSEEMGLVSLPSRIARYRQFRAKYPKDGVSAVLEVREHARHKLICDVTFFDLDAAVVARIDGYECTADASLRAAFRRAGIETAS